MPIYEYHCFDCDTRFEQRRTYEQSDDPLNCPQCEGERVKRLLSMFAVGVGQSSSSMSVSGRRAGGGCACGGACACSA
jgi:putative FmdB family regulatory protein